MRTLKLVTKYDIPELVNVAKSAFLDDDRFKPPAVTAGGPPGYDQIERHQEWLDTLVYYKCEENESIIGLCTIELTGNKARIHGINVASESMGNGVGSYMLREIQSKMPHVTKWTLITPDYATRNHHFYEKNGFVLKRKGDIEPDLGFGFYTYEKDIRQQHSA
jgi:hypothetical protein